MSQPELLRRVVQVLGDAGIQYMLTGSVVSSMQGEPRATHDADIVVDLPESAVEKLIEAFPPPDYYISAAAAREAIRRKTMFNLIDVREGDKIDFWMLTDEPFDHARFDRRREEQALQTSLQVSAPEDTILAKLRWFRLVGGSEKQFNDALRVYELQYHVLDMTHLDRWADQLGVSDLLEQLKTRAEVCEP